MTPMSKAQTKLYEEVLQIAMVANDITQSDLQGILEVIVRKYVIKNEPEYGKQYALTGATGTPCIANGNTWAESVVEK